MIILLCLLIIFPQMYAQENSYIKCFDITSLKLKSPKDTYSPSFDNMLLREEISQFGLLIRYFSCGCDYHYNWLDTYRLNKFPSSICREDCKSDLGYCLYDLETTILYPKGVDTEDDLWREERSQEFSDKRSYIKSTIEEWKNQRQLDQDPSNTIENLNNKIIFSEQPRKVYSIIADLRYLILNGQYEIIGRGPSENNKDIKEYAEFLQEKFLQGNYSALNEKIQEKFNQETKKAHNIYVYTKLASIYRIIFGLSMLSINACSIHMTHIDTKCLYYTLFFMPILAYSSIWIKKNRNLEIYFKNLRTKYNLNNAFNLNIS